MKRSFGQKLKTMIWRTVVTKIDEDGTIIEETDKREYTLVKKIKEKTLTLNGHSTVYWTYIYKLSNQLNLFK